MDMVDVFPSHEHYYSDIQSIGQFKKAKEMLEMD
jgi:hypothetical protein